MLSRMGPGGHILDAGAHWRIALLTSALRRAKESRHDSHVTPGPELCRTAVPIEMQFGMLSGMGPGGQTAGWIKMPLGTKVGLLISHSAEPSRAAMTVT